MIRVGGTVTVAEISKIFKYIVGYLNFVDQDRIERLNTGNMLGSTGAVLKVYYEPLDTVTEQYSGYIGGTLGTDSWLDRVYNDVQEVINRQGDKDG